MKTYRKLSLQNAILYATSFVGGVLVGRWVKPKQDKKQTNITNMIVSIEEDIDDLGRITERMDEEIAVLWKNVGFTRSDIMKLIRRFEGHIAENAEPCQEQEEAHTLADTQPIKVRYTAEEIMPKRYSNTNYPSGEDAYWTLNTRTKEQFGWAKDYLPFDSHTEWVIPVPGAPKELKPLKYPENTPNYGDTVITHNKISDKWVRNKFIKENERQWRLQVDWFIPYRISSQKGEK